MLSGERLSCSEALVRTTQGFLQEGKGTNSECVWRWTAGQADAGWGPWRDSRTRKCLAQDPILSWFVHLSLMQRLAGTLSIRTRASWSVPPGGRSRRHLHPCV